MSPTAQNTNENRLTKAIVDYYDHIDAGDINSVLGLFDKSGRYLRADACYEGKAAIERFYSDERKIIGKHTLHCVVSENNLIIVEGEFKGRGHDGSPKQIGFTDWWLFNERGRVVERKTYLAIGSTYVKE